MSDCCPYLTQTVRLSSHSSLPVSIDVLVWSNQRVIRWLQGVGLREYASRLADSGIHGAVIALDNNFDADTLALALQISNQNTQVSFVFG